MIVVADASVLVGELLRERGRALILRTELHMAVAEHQWAAADHELRRPLGILSGKGRISVRLSDVDGRDAAHRTRRKRGVMVPALEVPLTACPNPRRAGHR